MTDKVPQKALFTLLACPDCSTAFTGPDQDNPSSLVCLGCGKQIPLANGIPIFTEPPNNMAPSQSIARGPGMGTPWRQANWRFLQDQIANLDPTAVILDVGAGRGDFAAALTKHNCIELEVYPYPEIDIVCDLTQINPFKPASFDAILLFNVLEHVYDTHALVSRLAGLLKPGGILLVAIPFMVKIHQAPIDYVRFTHFALQQLASDHGLQVKQMEGYYDPVFFLGEGIGNLRNAVLSEARRRSGTTAYLSSRLLTKGLQILASGLQRTLGPGRVMPPEITQSLAPTGYQIVYYKPTHLPKKDNL